MEGLLVSALPDKPPLLLVKEFLTMATTYNRQSMGNLKTLLAPISESNPVGENLYYDPLYDQIKEARREDDPTLSQGVWQIELKKADWPLVENLCCQALISKTKDLQIAAWLAEAWIAMDQLEGIIKGINLLQSLSESYWDQIYPTMDDDDNERRLHMCEWLDTAFKKRLVMMPVLENPLNSSYVTLADWMQANRLDNISKRSPDRQKILKKAELNNELTSEKIHQILNACPTNLLETLNQNTTNAFNTYEAFKKSLDTLLVDNSRPGMNECSEALKELQRFIKVGLEMTNTEEKPPLEQEEELLPPPSLPTSDVESTKETVIAFTSSLPNRAAAYKMINDIGTFLQTIEPHSPAPTLLKRIATWENKSISDIFKDFGDTPEDWTAFAKFLGFGDKK